MNIFKKLKLMAIVLLFSQAANAYTVEGNYYVHRFETSNGGYTFIQLKTDIDQPPSKYCVLRESDDPKAHTSKNSVLMWLVTTETKGYFGCGNSGMGYFGNSYYNITQLGMAR